MKPITAGYGDEATWPDYDGHPNDPRRQDDSWEDRLEAMWEEDEKALRNMESFARWLFEDADPDLLKQLLNTENPGELLKTRNTLRNAYLRACFGY